MNIELLRTVMTYVIALVVIIGAGLLLILPTAVDKGELLPYVTAQTSAVIVYLFAERQTKAAGMAANGGAAISGAELTALHRRLDAAGIPPEPPPEADTETPA